MSARTTLPYESFRARLDAALSRSAVAHALRGGWSGTTLHLSAPGCRASATFDRGHFHGVFELTGAAWLIRQSIYRDLFHILRAAGCEDIQIG